MDNYCAFLNGRNLTNYTPSSDINNLFKINNNIKNNHDYRAFLQKHGVEIMKSSKKYARNYCDLNITESWRPQELSNQVCDENGCVTTDNNVNGLGLGRVLSDDKQCF
jgi:hypothetical protein